MSDTLKIKMTKTMDGSPDGVSCVKYLEGHVETFSGASAVDLGRVFIREGWAEEVVLEALVVEAIEEGFAVKAKPSTKQAPRPANKGRKKGR